MSEKDKEEYLKLEDGFDLSDCETMSSDDSKTNMGKRVLCTMYRHWFFYRGVYGCIDVANTWDYCLERRFKHEPKWTETGELNFFWIKTTVLEELLATIAEEEK